MDQTDQPDESGATSSRPALARCLSVSTDEFAATYWGTRPLLSPAASLTGDFDDLFDAAAVDELVSRRGLRAPFLRMATEGAVLPAGRFTRSGGLGASIGDQAADDKVLAEFAAGATLVLQGLHRTWPPLIDLAQQLATDLTHPVQVNAYVTPAANRGFDPHYDVHDVIVLQVAGQKRWRIHAPVHERPLPDQPWTDHRAAVRARAEQEPHLDTVLSPGDALYLPRGWLHSAEALGETTIHLTIGIHAITRYDVLRDLLALAADSPELRSSLPVGVDPDDPDSLGPDLEATVKALTERLGAMSTQDVARGLRRRIADSTRPEPIGPLRQVEAAAAVTADSVVRLRRHGQPRLATAADGLRLTLGTRTVTAEPETRAALEVLLSGADVRVGDLPGLTPEHACAFVARLLREAVVVPR